MSAYPYVFAIAPVQSDQETLIAHEGFAGYYAPAQDGQAGRGLRALDWGYSPVLRTLARAGVVFVWATGNPGP